MKIIFNGLMLFFLMTSQLFAQECAYISSSGQLVVPQVYVNGQYLKASFNFLNTELTLMEVADTAQSSVSSEAAYYSMSVQNLKLPCVRIGEQDYWASFMLEDASRLRFRLTGYGQGNSGITLPIMDSEGLAAVFQADAKSHLQALRETSLIAMSKVNQALASTSIDPQVIAQEFNSALTELQQMEQVALNAETFVNKGIKKYAAFINLAVAASDPSPTSNGFPLMNPPVSYSSKGSAMTWSAKKNSIDLQLYEAAKNIYTTAVSARKSLQAASDYVSKRHLRAWSDADWTELKRKAYVAVKGTSKVLLWVGTAAGTIAAFAALPVTAPASAVFVGSLSIVGTMTLGMGNAVITSADTLTEIVYNDPKRLIGHTVPIFGHADKALGMIGIAGANTAKEVASGVLSTYFDDIVNIAGQDISHADGKYESGGAMSIEAVLPQMNIACQSMQKSFNGIVCKPTRVNPLLPPGTWKDPETGETIIVPEMPEWLAELLGFETMSDNEITALKCPMTVDVDANGRSLEVNTKDQDGDGIRDDYIYCYYYNSGQLDKETPRINNMKDGMQKAYYESGIFYWYVNWVKGIREGMSKEYYESGQLKSERPWNNGKLNGIEKRYYESGFLEEKVQWSYGELNGQRISYFPDGQISAISSYADGEINGVYQIFDAGGCLKYDAIYNHGSVVEEERYLCN